ncbi:glutamate receptor ionotropic, kainate 2-like isoform 1-T1 [Glossina fuscipes fuscipes]
MFLKIFIIFLIERISINNGVKAFYPLNGYDGTLNNIHLGLISDLNADYLRRTFDYAIEVVNSDLTVPLRGHQETMDYGNIMQGINQLCKLTKLGVGGIFAPSAENTASYLMHMCDSKDIPFIYSHLSGRYDAFNLHPHPLDIAKAIHAIVEQFEWSRFIYLYENSEFLSILDALMSLYVTTGPVINIIHYDLNLNGNFKSVLRRVRKSVDNRILIVGSTQSVAELLKQAQQVGIMNEDYKYIIGNLDFHTFDLEEYKYSEANITGMRMFSAEQSEVRNLMQNLGYLDETTEHEIIRNGSCPITIEMALIYDAVVAFAETTKYLHYAPHALNCSDFSIDVLEDGTTFKNYMRSILLDRNTITGHIYFEGSIRKGSQFEIIELQPTGLIKVGTWQEHKNFTFERPIQMKPIADNVDNSMINKTLRVLIAVPNKPYASLVESHKKLDGNSQYEGYGIDLIKELADKLGFNFTFINGGNDYGSFNKTTNVTTGMLKEMVEGRADLAVTDLTITSEREEVIDFSIPFMNLGIGILYLKPQKSNPTTFSFMDPFSKEVWIYLGLAYLGVSLCFFILGRLSPTEWDNPYPCVEEPDELENQFTINNALWFTTGALLQQGSEVAPKALSTRTVAAIWCFFTLIMVSSYTANLAAFLTIENPTSLLENVQDLSENKGGVQYGAKRTGSTRNFFLTSEEEIYKKMNEYMLAHPEYLTETNQEGLERVKSSDVQNGKTYAFLMESTSIEYNTQRECKLTKIGEALDEKGYGIAMVKNWPYRDKFNNALLELQEQGVLAQLKNKWWNEIGAGVCNSKSDGGVSPLAFSNLEGIYYVLIVGCAISMVFGIINWCFEVARKAQNYNVPFSAAVKEEFKAVTDFTNNERLLKCANSIYSRSRNSSIDSTIDSFETDSNDESMSENEKEE